MDIASKIKNIRALLRYNQGDLARELGVSQKDISLLENGKKEFIPKWYIDFLIKNDVDLNTFYDDSKDVVINSKSTRNLTLENGKENGKVFSIKPKVQETLPIYDNKSVDILAEEMGKIFDKKPTKQDPILLELHPSSRANTVMADVKASAGFGSIAGNSQALEALPAIYLPNAPHGLNVAFQITGDSMHPTIRHLDYVAGNQIHTLEDIRDGYVYIIVDRQDGVLCKRINKMGQDVEILSDNSTYKPYKRSRHDIIAIYKAFARLSYDFRSYQDDIRSDIADLKNEVNILKKNQLIWLGKNEH